MKPDTPIHNNQPRRVDFNTYDEDYECAYLGSLGFSTRYIAFRTKLTPGKITYRLRKAAVRRMDYRNGDSEFATIVMRNLRPVLTKHLDKFLKIGH